MIREFISEILQCSDVGWLCLLTETHGVDDECAKLADNISAQIHNYISELVRDGKRSGVWYSVQPVVRGYTVPFEVEITLSDSEETYGDATTTQLGLRSSKVKAKYVVNKTNYDMPTIKSLLLHELHHCLQNAEGGERYRKNLAKTSYPKLLKTVTQTGEGERIVADAVRQAVYRTSKIEVQSYFASSSVELDRDLADADDVYKYGDIINDNKYLNCYINILNTLEWAIRNGYGDYLTYCYNTYAVRRASDAKTAYSRLVKKLRKAIKHISYRLAKRYVDKVYGNGDGTYGIACTTRGI